MSDEREQNPNQGSGHELSFALNFEVNLMNDFELDAEFRPVGCGGDLQNMWWAWRSDRKVELQTKVKQRFVNISQSRRRPLVGAFSASSA